MPNFIEGSAGYIHWGLGIQAPGSRSPLAAAWHDGKAAATVQFRRFYPSAPVLRGAMPLLAADKIGPHSRLQEGIKIGRMSNKEYCRMVHLSDSLVGCIVDNTHVTPVDVCVITSYGILCRLDAPTLMRGATTEPGELTAGATGTTGATEASLSQPYWVRIAPPHPNTAGVGTRECMVRMVLVRTYTAQRVSRASSFGMLETLASAGRRRLTSVKWERCVRPCPEPSSLKR